MRNLMLITVRASRVEINLRKGKILEGKKGQAGKGNIGKTRLVGMDVS